AWPHERRLCNGRCLGSHHFKHLTVPHPRGGASATAHLADDRSTCFASVRVEEVRRLIELEGLSIQRYVASEKFIWRCWITVSWSFPMVRIDVILNIVSERRLPEIRISAPRDEHSPVRKKQCDRGIPPRLVPRGHHAKSARQLKHQRRHGGRRVRGTLPFVSVVTTNDQHGLIRQEHTVSVGAA